MVTVEKDEVEVWQGTLDKEGVKGERERGDGPT